VIVGPVQHLTMPQGAASIVISGAPMLFHAEARELVILAMALVALCAIDQTNDVVDLGCLAASPPRCSSSCRRGSVSTTHCRGVLETAVPVVFSVNLDRWQTRRQRAARHYVLGPDRVRRSVEVDEVSAPSNTLLVESDSDLTVGDIATSSDALAIHPDPMRCWRSRCTPSTQPTEHDPPSRLGWPSSRRGGRMLRDLPRWCRAAPLG
jgi:hypothetical protein